MKRFGLIGFPLSHSFSQKYFTEKFEKEKIRDCVYDKFPLGNISELRALMDSHPDLRGLNVTIPYKEKVLPYLDQYDEVVRATGACNCIRVDQEKLTGFNTDTTGFRVSLQRQLQPHHRSALILGKGGAAKAVAYVLAQLQIDFLFVVRKKDDDPRTIRFDELDDSVMRAHLLIVNATPLGTHPDTDNFPPIPYQFISGQHYLYDLVYNPPQTAFLRQGRERGAITQNGADMLVIQAEESWKIWNRDAS